MDKDIIVRGYTPVRKGMKNGKPYKYYYIQIKYSVGGEKPVTETHSIGKVTSKAEAKDKMLNLVMEKRETLSHNMLLKKDEKRIIFIDSLFNWVNSRKGEIEQDTWDTYNNRAHSIARYFDNLAESRGVDCIYLDEINTIMINEYYVYALEHGKLNKKTGETSALSRDTVLSYAGLLHNYFEAMCVNEHIRENPCVRAKIPRRKKQNTKEKEYLNSSQLKEFVKILKESYDAKYLPVVELCVAYGLRRSEALGLRWDSINWNEDVLTIKYTRVKGNKEYNRENTKSESSHRVYPLIEPIRNTLKSIKKLQIETGEYTEEGLVFWDMEKKKPYSLDYTSKVFKKAVKNCESIPDTVHFHDLRRTTVSLLLENGFTTDEMSLWIGHKTGSKVLFDHYLNITMKWKREKGKLVEKALEGIF